MKLTEAGYVFSFLLEAFRSQNMSFLESVLLRSMSTVHHLFLFVCEWEVFIVPCFEIKGSLIYLFDCWLLIKFERMTCLCTAPCLKERRIFNAGNCRKGKKTALCELPQCSLRKQHKVTIIHTSTVSRVL